MVHSFMMIVAALLHAAQTADIGEFCMDSDTDGGQMMLQVAAGAHREAPDGVTGRGKWQEESYHWSQRGGNARTSSATSQVAPHDFSAGPAWVWENPLDEQVRHSPLIDDKMHIYVTTTTRVRKFSPSGEILWTWKCPPLYPKIVTSPALHKGRIFVQAGAASGTADLYALNMSSGHQVWKRSTPGFINEDANALAVVDDAIILPMHNGTLQDTLNMNTNKFVALSAWDGSNLWEYVADDIVWNAAPATPGDGTLLFSGSCGGAFRISSDGKLIWRAGPPAVLDQSGVPMPIFCSTGGGALGPNGVFYTEYSRRGIVFISAYRISDGTLLWEKAFSDVGGGAQYPAVGKLGLDGPLAVVLALGGGTGIPTYMLDPIYKAYDQNSTVRELMGAPKLRNIVMALDANNGNLLWEWEEKIWDRFGAAGDEERTQRITKPDIEGIICLPDVQGIPVITGDGTIFASSSHGGELTAIRDVDGNGIIESSEVSSFATHNCFLNSPSVAPGMLVAAPCWGPMYVFKS